jgi:cation diffusion facilitator CzcD-associated flavoprotein CzcO
MEHLDVLVVGAGISGVGAGYYLQKNCPWAEYAIFEGRESMGGTWDLFKYPGIRSDSDMHTLGFAFRPWDGEKTIADGASILQYIKDTARETGVEKNIRYSHKVLAADWSTDDARWLITAERTDTGETFQLTAGFVFGCTGYYRYDKGYTPEFPGRERFRGQVIHPQFWPEDLDYENKKVVVIGSGATAVTLVPSMADKAAHVTMLQRSPTYIASAPASSPLAKILRKIPGSFGQSVLRWALALGTQGSYFLSKRRPEIVKAAIRRQTISMLPKGYDMKHFTPKYNPWDERFCLVPDGDLFKAIRSGKVTMVTDTIKTFDETGIEVDSGDHIDADIIVTATGLEVVFAGGMQATVDGEPLDVSQRLTYKGMMLEGVPNFAFAIGYSNASWTLKVDLTAEYVTKLLNHMHNHGMQQVTIDGTNAEHSDAPLFGLNSGYINRAANRMPRQGAAFPWKVKMSYLADYNAMKRKPYLDEYTKFTNPKKSKVSA